MTDQDPSGAVPSANQPGTPAEPQTPAYTPQPPAAPYAAPTVPQPTTPQPAQPAYPPYAAPQPAGYAPAQPAGYPPQPPAAYGPGAASPAGPPAVPTAAPGAGGPQPKKFNILGLIALIVAVVGFVFACIPGWLIVGWILLPIAFVLSIIGFFVKAGKALPIAALVVSILGTIAGFVVFFLVFFASVNSTVTTLQGDSEQVDGGSSTDGSADVPDDAAQPGGSVALGEPITGDEWTVVVNSFTADANQAVVDASPINEPAPAGSHYATVNYTVTYTGADTAFGAYVAISLVTATGEELNSYDVMAILPDSILLTELANGESATGSAAFVVPDGTDVQIVVRPGMLADEVAVTP